MGTTGRCAREGRFGLRVGRGNGGPSSLFGLSPIYRQRFERGKQSCLVIDVGSPAQVDVTLGDQPGVQRIGLDELLTGARTPLSQERRDQMEQVVLEGTDRYQRALVRQSWRGVWKTYQQQTDALTRQSLPSCLERHGFAEGSPQRVALEDELRRMILRYGHGLLDAMAQGGSPPSRKRKGIRKEVRSDSTIEAWNAWEPTRVGSGTRSRCVSGR